MVNARTLLAYTFLVQIPPYDTYTNIHIAPFLLAILTANRIICALFLLLSNSLRYLACAFRTPLFRNHFSQRKLLHTHSQANVIVFIFKNDRRHTFTQICLA